MRPRLLIVTSHPIQYQAPWFRALHQDGRVDLKVLFLAMPEPHQQGSGFDQPFEWDVSLLDGFSWDLAPSARGTVGGGWTQLRVGRPRKAMSAYPADVVLVLGWHYLGMAQSILAATRLELPVIVRGDSNGLAPIPMLSRFRSRFLLRNVSLIGVVGAANRRYYEKLGLGHKRLLHIPHFVDNQFFRSRSGGENQERRNLRESLGIPPQSLCFLFAGKLQKKKRPGDLLLATERALVSTSRPIHVLIVGAGEMENALREQASTRQLPVSFAGFLNQTRMPAAYAVADCLVLPSDFGETWGLVVNEAMACGLPAIVSDRVGCGPDLVTGGETGFTFRFGNVENLAGCMTKMAKLNDTERRAMGEKARDRVLTRYSIGRAVENTIAATFELLSRETSH